MVNKKIIAIVIAVNVVLVASIVTMYFTLWKPNTPDGEIGTLTITGLEGEDIVFNITELEDLPANSSNYIIQGNPTYTANYTGVSVFYLITEVAGLSNNSLRFKILSSDGYFKIFTFSELNSYRNIIVAYLKNSEYIKSGQQGGNGPLRLIVPQSYTLDGYNGLYCVKFTSTIQVLEN